MAREGRYKKVKENLEAKEVGVGDRGHGCGTYWSEEAEGNRVQRKQMPKNPREALAQPEGSEQTKLCCEPASVSLYGTYVPIAEAEHHGVHLGEQYIFENFNAKPRLMPPRSRKPPSNFLEVKCTGLPHGAQPPPWLVYLLCSTVAW